MVKKSGPGFRQTWAGVSGLASGRLLASDFIIQSLRFRTWNMRMEEKSGERGIWDPNREKPFLSLHLRDPNCHVWRVWGGSPGGG